MRLAQESIGSGTGWRSQNLKKEKTMQETKKENQNTELNLDLFNVSGEFEDIEIVINEISGQVEMAVAARRC